MGQFGDFVKSRRAELELGLREFSEQLGYDPSNWSKIERGLFQPPQDRDLLERVGKLLQLADNPTALQEMHDKADLDRGQLPKDITEDSYVMSMLPAVMRTIRETKPTSEEIEELITLLRNDFRKGRR